jgi:hypothetical protein
MNQSKGDERYLDALIAASLLGQQAREPSEEEIDAIINSAPEVRPEDERIQQRMEGLFAQMFGTSPLPESEVEATTPGTTDSRFAAMNRGNEDNAFSDEVSDELRRAREEALKKLKEEQSKRQQGGNDAQPD